MSLDWFPWFPHDFRRDTRHLSLEEDGAYRRLIDEYMITRQALPADAAALARVLGIPKAEWDRIAPRVIRFFKLRNDRLWHKRCEQEIRAQNARNNRNSERGKKAALKRWQKNNGLDAKPLLTHATLHNKEKITSSEQEAAREAVPTGTASPSEPQKAVRLEDWKPPNQTSRAELEATFAKRKAAS